MGGLIGISTKKQGMSPGSVFYTGERHVETAILDLIQYGADTLREETGLSLEGVRASPTPGRVTWIDMVGLHDTQLLESLGNAFHLHPLTLEDIASVGQRPKVEYFPEYIFVVLRLLNIAEDGRLRSEQLAIVLADGLVLTFRERPGGVLEPLRERIRRDRSRIRELDADYLFYALIDIVVDAYFLVLEGYGDDIEELEIQLTGESSPELLQTLGSRKRELLLMRKAVWPVRELLATLRREESPLIGNAVLTFLNDVHDHCIQVIDTVETLREMLSGLHDLYLSSLSQRMNEVMKVLTVIATIFIPLSFLVGVYGMNFDHLPELHLSWGYPGLWLVMTAIAAGMLNFFRRRRWL